jgi:hypothetical protein
MAAGTSKFAYPSNDRLAFGQALISGMYWGYQAFVGFTYTPNAEEKITAAYIRLKGKTTFNPSSPTRNMTMVEYDYGGTVDTGDWRTIVQLQALPQMANVLNAGDTLGEVFFAGTDALVARLASAGPLRLNLASDLQRVGSVPTNNQTTTLYSAETSGTVDDPALIYTTVVENNLNGVLGAQVQLTDGTHAYLERSGSTVTLKHHNGTSASTVATLPTGTGASQFSLPTHGTGAQQLALVGDSANNLYVLGPRGSGPITHLAGLAYTKGSGYTWTAQTVRVGSVPSYLEAALNNVAGTWHNLGNAGTIMCVFAHTMGRTGSAFTEMGYALLACDHLLTGAGTGLFRSSGQARGAVVEGNYAVSGYHVTHQNETGTGLDVAKAVGDETRGYIMSFWPSQELGTNGVFYSSRYVLAADGSSYTNARTSNVGATWAVKDANAKVRILAVDATQYVHITCDADTGFGATVKAVQNFGTSSSFTMLGSVYLDDESISTMPAAATLASSANWDAVYDPIANKVWFYYFSAADNRRLLRTSIDLNTYLAVGDVVEVSAAVGAAGSENAAIRVHRGQTFGSKILVAVSNETSGGVHSTQYVLDSLNQAPNSPTLTPKVNFDAATSATLAWTFSDPNPADTQSAYQVQIDTSGGVFEYDSGKITGTAATLGAVGAAATGNNATVNPALPAGLVEGQTMLMLASIRNSGTGTVNTPTGWQPLAASGNLALFGRVAGSSESVPAVSFTGGVANADTIAQIASFNNLPLNVVTSNTQLNASAANVAYPALTITVANGVVVYAGWKQDDSTGWAAVAGTAELGEANPTAGDDASQAWDWVAQTTATNVSAGSFTVSGGGSAISRGMVVQLGPAGHTATASTHTLPANTLTNGQTWQWRVRTWDSAGMVGPWSGYGSFSTASGGAVTVTDPATDDPAGVVTDEYDIDWSVTGTTQNDYRVVLVRTDTGATVSDTGWLNGPAVTNRVVSGMVTDVRHRIDVKVRNVGLVESGTGSRYLTPSYGSPEVPVVTATGVTEDGCIVVSVNNPVPGSTSLGTVPYDFEAGVTGFTATGCTFAQSNTVARVGTYSGKMTVTGTPTSAYVRPPLADSPVIVPGTRYTVAFWAYSADGHGDLAAAIDWYDASNVYLSTSSVSASVAAGVWEYRSYSATAPTGAAKAVFGPTLGTNPPTAEVLYIDELVLTHANDKPAVTSNQIMRRVAGSGDEFQVIATVVEDGTYRDYAVASGKAYEYKVRGYA